MKRKISVPHKIFGVCNAALLTVLGLVCLLPLVNLLAVSLSAKGYVEAGRVGLWPKGFTWDSYGYVFSTGQFYSALWVSAQRAVIGTLVSLALTVLLAYPLSRPSAVFRGRNAYMWLVLFSMLFSGGLIPTYLVVANSLALKDTVWALVLPGAINVFNAIIMMNFFRQLPREIEEAAYVDGANHFHTLAGVILPVSLPILATVTLFAFIGQWNSWFDGLIYNTQPEGYPLQTYLQQFMAEPPKTNIGLVYVETSNNSLASANIFIIMLPILLIYPLLQRYFIKGMVLGSVKG
jgi:putative aldouronate transport system permease protein